ncbi:MAG: hypothetical protein AAFP19_13045 [Bacteroidota bacterium]
MNYPALYVAVLLSLGIILACGDTSNKHPSKVATMNVDSTDTALPHGASLPLSQLSEADKRKLAQAKGKSVQLIQPDTLRDQMQKSKGPLQVINFWRLDCESCHQLNLHLQQLAAELEEEQLRLIYLNLDSPVAQPAVNAYIREHSLLQSTYQLQIPDTLGWEQRFHPNWSGDLPALWLYDAEEGIDFLYRQEWTFEELVAVIQPFMVR